MTSIQLSTQHTFKPAPTDISSLGGVPVPVGSIMFGVEAGGIYRFGETNDAKGRDWVEGGLEFYGIKGITRWETESKDGKYGTLSYIRFHFVSPYKGVTYCLQLSDGANRDNKAICPPAHVRGLVQSLLKAKRDMAQTCPNGSLSLLPGVISPKAGNDNNVTFLNLFVGADPFDSNSLNQVFCEEDERLEKDFDAFDAAIDELCEQLGQETPPTTGEGAVTAEDVANAVNIDSQEEMDNDVLPF